MKAVVCTKYGAPDVLQLQEVAKPVPSDNEILVKIREATVTAAGLVGLRGRPLFVRLFMGLSKPRRNVPGMEFAGIIESVGRDVTRFEEGDQVFGITGTGLGALAEYKCLPEDAAVISKPTSMSDGEAAAVVEGGLTALKFLKTKAQIQRGQKVLVYGASGSVGTASVQIASALGTEVTGVCSTHNIELVRSLGADNVIDYTQADFTESGLTYDVIFDTVGKLSFSRCKGSLTQTGAYLDTTGLATVFSMIWTSMFGTRKAIFATTYTGQPRELRKDLIFLRELIETGKVRAVIDRIYPLEEIVEANRYVETGRKKGNVVITVAGRNT